MLHGAKKQNREYKDSERAKEKEEKNEPRAEQIREGNVAAQCSRDYLGDYVNVGRALLSSSARRRARLIARIARDSPTDDSFRCTDN